MQKKLGQLFKGVDKSDKSDKHPSPPLSQPTESGLTYKAVLGFLKEKGLGNTVLKLVYEAQRRNAEQHPLTVVTATWRVEG